MSRNLPSQSPVGETPLVDSVLSIKEKPSRGIDFFSSDDPRSLINILPSYVADNVQRVPRELLELNEGDISRKVHSEKLMSPELRMLRVAFWAEYDKAQAMMRKMNMTNVFGGVCSITYFRNRVVTNPLMLAYILTPVSEYEVNIKELLVYGLAQLREILSLPHVDKNGKPDPKMAEVKVKIVQDLITRDRGSVVHKIESKNLHMNVNQNVPDGRDMRSVERELEELQRELIEGDVIDVKAEEPRDGD